MELKMWVLKVVKDEVVLDILSPVMKVFRGFLALCCGTPLLLGCTRAFAKGLVKDAEGDVVSIVVHPLEKDEVDRAVAENSRQIYLKYVPLGFWVRMDKYSSGPANGIFEENEREQIAGDTRSLVFVEPPPRRSLEEVIGTH